jgi:hypothetical protein
MSIEIDLKNLITQKFGTITNFSKSTGIPNSTLSSIFQRGVLNANVLNMITICDALAIDIDSLADGKIEPKKVNVNISLKEQQLLIAYNQHKEFQLAIDTLLGIAESPQQRIVQTKAPEPQQTFTVREVARYGQSEEKTLTKEYLDFIKANQETEDSEL